jgi:hypothetical protein
MQKKYKTMAVGAVAVGLALASAAPAMADQRGWYQPTGGTYSLEIGGCWLELWMNHPAKGQYWAYARTVSEADFITCTEFVRSYYKGSFDHDGTKFNVSSSQGYVTTGGSWDSGSWTAKACVYSYGSLGGSTVSGCTSAY